MLYSTLVPTSFVSLLTQESGFCDSLSVNIVFKFHTRLRYSTIQICGFICQVLRYMSLRVFLEPTYCQSKFCETADSVLYGLETFLHSYTKPQSLFFVCGMFVPVPQVRHQLLMNTIFFKDMFDLIIGIINVNKSLCMVACSTLFKGFKVEFS